MAPSTGVITTRRWLAQPRLSHAAVRVVIKDLHRVGYAEPNEWSRQMPGKMLLRFAYQI